MLLLIKKPPSVICALSRARGDTEPRPTWPQRPPKSHQEDENVLFSSLSGHVLALELLSELIGIEMQSSFLITRHRSDCSVIN